MNRLLIISFVFFLHANLFAQNLVPNPSFELNSSCPSSYAQISNVSTWFNPTSHTGSADYFHTCTSSPYISVPLNYWGDELPATGDAYIGINILYYAFPDFREYVQVPLNSPLVAGTTYNVSFKCSLADKSTYSSPNVSVHFSNAPITGANNNEPISVTPQVTINYPIDNKVGWTQVSETYIATGGEQYLTIGNFLDDASTTLNFIGNNGHNGTYLYLDDVSVIIDTCHLNLGNDTTLCLGETLLLDASATNATYLWQDNSTDSTLQVTQAGTYWVQVTASCGTITDTIFVNYDTAPTIEIGNDTSLCQGASLLLDASTPNATYLWQDNSTDSTLLVTQGGTYWVQVIDRCGSTVTDTIQITYTTAPTLELGNDTTICQGITLNLDATTANATYLWQDNSTNATFQVSQTGMYWVQMSNGCGTISDTIDITYNISPTIMLGNDTTVCVGTTLTLDATTNNVSYLWQDNSIDSTFLVSEQGSYWVQLTDNCGTSSDTIQIDFYTTPTLDLGSDTSLCQGAILLLDASAANGTYLWHDNSTQASFEVQEEGLYWVKVTNICGEWEDQINVQMKVCNCSLELPNAFTPNGDNLNEKYKVLSTCSFSDFNFSIYDRWGTKVFQSEDPILGWDGQLKGIAMPQDTYTYHLSYRFMDAEKMQQISGHVSLFR